MAAAIRDLEPSPEEQDAKIRSFIRDKHFVFVSGYLGCSPRDFSDMKTFIQTLDPHVPVTKICPPPNTAIENNVEFLIEQIRDSSTKSPERKVILLGQSKGGAEVLQTLATHPELLDPGNRHGFEIARVFTLSAAIGGSVLADLALKTDPGLVARWETFKKKNNVPDGLFVAFLKRVFFDPTTEGFHSLSTLKSRERNERLLNLVSEETRWRLKDKLYFITARRDGKSDDMPFYLQWIARFMSEETQPNDGLVYEKDQRLSELGTHLYEVSRAGHFSLVGEYDNPDCRKEFTRLLLLKMTTL